MRDSHRTLAEWVADYHAADPLNVSSVDNDRLWVHDMLHTILGFSVNTGHGELLTGIYQAVLLRDVSCKTNVKQHCDHGEIVAERSIRQQVLPGLHDFLSSLGKKSGFTPRAKLTDEEIQDHYYTAVALRHLLENKLQENGLGDRLGEVPVSTLKEMSPQFFTELVDTARASFAKVKRYAEAVAAPKVPFP